MKVRIEDLDMGLQTRTETSEETIREYAESMGSGVEFPPVVVYSDPLGTRLVLAEGYHRVGAAKLLGRAEIEAEVRRGDIRDAWICALGSNADKPLTNADKRNKLDLAWRNRRILFGDNDPTAGWLAKVCRVSIPTAKNFYSQISINYTDCLTTERQSETGRVYTVPPRPPRRRQETAVQPPPRRPAPAPEPAAEVVDSLSAAEDIPPPPRRPERVPGIVLDRFGVEVPPRVRAAFTARDLDDALRHVSAARSVLRAAKERGSAEVAQVRQALQFEVDKIYRELRLSKPYCVCRMCQGEGCRACGETGFQTEDQYGRNPPEYKAVEG